MGVQKSNILLVSMLLERFNTEVKEHTIHWQRVKDMIQEEVIQEDIQGWMLP